MQIVYHDQVPILIGMNTAVETNELLGNILGIARVIAHAPGRRTVSKILCKSALEFMPDMHPFLTSVTHHDIAIFDLGRRTAR